jgi:hypothetical protein
MVYNLYRFKLFIKIIYFNYNKKYIIICFIFRNLICNLISNYIMLFWIIKTTILCIIFIFLVHYLINFFKSTLTVPKIKDLVNTPTKKYESMYNILKNPDKPSFNKNNNSSDDYTLIDLLPTSTEIGEAGEETMKKELKNFLKKQLHEPTKSDYLPLESNF